MKISKKRILLPLLFILLPLFPLVSMPSASADPGTVSKTYTLDADFAMGSLVGVEYDTVPDQLQLSEETSTFSNLWIANAGEDTLSKWDTTTNKEVARYNTWFSTEGDHSAWAGASPSRTCVDGEGNCYVGNRHFDNRPMDVIKIFADEWIDRNGNGVLDTSKDLDNDGQISPGEMLPLYDSNFNGIIDPNEILDERIAWVQRVGGDGGLGRSLSIDTDGNIWAGLYSHHAYYKLSSVDGSILGGPYSTGAHTPYGSLVDKHGILWSSSLSTNLFYLDTNNPSDNGIYYENLCYTYGMALSYDEFDNTIVYLADSSNGHGYIKFNSSSLVFSSGPAIFPSIRSLGIGTDPFGNVVIADSGSGFPIKYDSAGNELWRNYGTPVSETRGVIIDSENNVWLCQRGISKISKHDGATGAYLGTFNAGLYPYTYSDATGISFQQIITQAGYWRVIFDSEDPGTKWGKVSWTDYIPTGGMIEVRVRSSEDSSSWTPWFAVTNDMYFDYVPDGRYLEIDVKFSIGDEDQSPILYDLTVQIGNPKSLKMEALSLLNEIDTGIRSIDYSNTYIECQIERSLTTSYWIDESHLTHEYGDRVFYYEWKAINYMEKMIVKYLDVIEYLETSPHIDECGEWYGYLYPQYSQSLYYADPAIMIPLLEHIIATYEQAMQYLVLADMLLAQILYDDAASIAVYDPELAEDVAMNLDISECYFNHGYEAMLLEEWEDANFYYRMAWRYARNAKDLAMTQEPPIPI